MGTSILNWISVLDALPLTDYSSEDIVSEYFVIVKPKDDDPNESPVVLILWFSSKTKHFSHSPGGVSYESQHSHYVSHWSEIPTNLP